MRRTLPLFAVLLSCGGSNTQPQVSCGPGTTEVDGTCRAAISACGPGTTLQGATCVSTPSCGAGTHAQNGACVPDSTVSCGAGTLLSGDMCVAADGTRYALRIAQDPVPADGISRIPVFAVGLQPDGGTVTDAVVVQVAPSFAGSLAPAAFDLGAFGSTSYFTPCNAFSSSACMGQVELSLSLASAPSVPVVSTTFTLAQPTGVGSAAPCLLGGNTLYFDGDSGNYIFSGMQTVTLGTWGGTYNAASNYAHISVTPSSSSQGLWWDVEMTSGDTGPLQVGVYENAERYPFQSPGHPGFDVSGDGRGCNTVSGKFQIEELAVDAGVLTGFTATFEHHCEGGAAALRGCVHWGG